MRALVAACKGQGHQHGHAAAAERAGTPAQPCSTTGRHSARRKVTNFLLIPPRAPLFRPPSSWGIALMAFSPGRVCTRVCRENMRSVHGVCQRCMEHAEGALEHRTCARGVQEGTWTVHMGAGTRVCSKCAHSVRRGCTEHAREHVERTHMERVAKAAECAQSVYGVCRLSTEPAWPL